MARRINVLPIPDLGRSGTQSAEQVRAAMDRCVAALSQGDNLVLYPAGHINRRHSEQIGANSAVERILRDLPDVRIVLAELPEERRDAITQVRETILERLPDGYEETMNWGMIVYQVPMSVYPETYNSQPLMLAGLASQKDHMAVYLSAIYAEEGARDRFESAYRTTGKRFDVGKSCVRFRKLDDLPLDVIGDAIEAFPVDQFIEAYERGRSHVRGRPEKG